MKITGVETYLLRVLVDPYTYGASSKGWIRDRSSLLVRIRTDEGIEGWGEGGQTGPPEFTKMVVEHSLAPLLMGADPFATSALWERMYDVTRDYGQKGVVVGAISAMYQRQSLRERERRTTRRYPRARATRSTLSRPGAR